MSDRLLLDLDAFYLEHRLCGDLNGDATDERAWLACGACGARIEQSIPNCRPDRMHVAPSEWTLDE